MSGRILIAGTRSGCGKTTVVCALLAALKSRRVSLAAFKCGPDYIDPMFHRKAMGIPSYNLDPYFCGGEKLRAMLAAKKSALCVIEGAMGYYDGVGKNGDYSAYTVAAETKTPVILTIDVKGMYASAGAELSGFLKYRENSGIRGVIFNNASQAIYGGLSEIAREFRVESLGFLPREASVGIKSRNLGLVAANELDDIMQKIDALGELAKRFLELDRIQSIADSAPELAHTRRKLKPVGKVRLAAARDAAFCFIYQENIDMLSELGCEIVYFSPVFDRHLPAGIDGLYLPGGYPELYLSQLESNASMREEIRAAVLDGMPTVAECGGFMYLQSSIDGCSAAGAINGSAFKTDKLRRFGYVELTSGNDNMLCSKGGIMRAHEFHYYDSTDNGGGYTAKKAGSGAEYACVHTSKSLYAGFPHIYFPANEEAAIRFARQAAEYAKLRKKRESLNS